MSDPTDAERQKWIDDIRRGHEIMKAEDAERRRRWWQLRVDDEGWLWTDWFRKEDDGTSTPAGSTREGFTRPGMTMRELTRIWHTTDIFSGSEKV